MKHPIYRDAYLAKMYSIWKNDKALFYEQAMAFIRNGVETEESILSYMDDFAMMAAIEGNGMVLIEVDRDEWNSAISRKTLSEMKVGDIKLPFNAGAIQSSTFDEGYMLFARAVSETTGEGALRFQIPVKNIPEERMPSYAKGNNPEDGIGLLTITLPNSLYVADAVSEIDEEGANYVYSILSILMYISLFKNDRERVKEVKLKACSASKKNGVPKHRVNRVVLKQKVSKDKDGVVSSKRGKLKRAHIVRGHWRNQWYASEGINKPKWIDPYWKGEGKEKLEKIYVVK